MNLWVVFITGLTVGGLTCLAVQGGLLASVIAAREEEEVEKGINTRNTVIPTLTFLQAKLGAHVLLGFLLGAFGSAISINQSAQITMQFFAGVYMVAVALNLLNVHPIFRYVIIQPPRFLTRHIRSRSKSRQLFAPALLGAMTIFIPCGTTLAMAALAISSANPLMGAAIMGVFVAGTSPLFFGLGWLTSVMGDTFRSRFLKIAALGVLYLGLVSINGSFAAAGSPLAFSSFFNPFATQNTNIVTSEITSGTQQATIVITSGGYSPQVLRVQKNIPLELTLSSQDAYSCASAFRIPSWGITKNLLPNSKEIIKITPTQSGNVMFTCSMGMYRGVIEVI